MSEEVRTGRALIIEDSAPLRASYSEYLDEKGFEVYTARGAQDAMVLLQAVKPDVTTLDIEVTGDDGFEMIRRIQQSGSLCMVVSTQDSPADRIRALSMGADDYALKPLDPEELFLRLRNMLAHRQSATPELPSTTLDLQGVRVNLVTRTILRADGARGVELTATELIFLRMLADHFERVVSKDALFAAVNGQVDFPKTRSLDVCMSRLRIKLRRSEAPVDIRSVRQAGYLMAPKLVSKTDED